MVSAYDSRILGPLFGEAAIAGLFDDAETVRSMALVEAALARAEAALGIVPAEAAARITEAVDGFSPDLAALGDGAEQAGVAVIAFVQQFRAHVGDDAGQWLHWGRPARTSSTPR